ncbi:MAG: DUF512 domain-containing protein [Acidobacteria bacterium]|nr:MAG: DUF512 domain-containing protein [Acidobacteriota bacterium]REJ98892.1 MAG: DUF512 domain-containing protein [Acidobacteriota bacterium]REK16388.1 MAG: DUF512 domain-containing protein [Acidobacteriota bacterium]REK44069.1 MAG: DUF512 domain-containing protein [Acidobacteriota bacterium]
MYEFAVTPAITQLRRPGVTIDSVSSGSIADEIGLESGDRITKVNGRAVRDYLDFRFQTSGEVEMIFLVKKVGGETWEVDLERDEGEDLGIEFEQIIPRQCANECIFCFCKGNPEDARPSLFVRDEDIRLSFLYGNYTTLSSVTEAEMQRIIEQRLSPQYVSVHSTDVKTRAYLLGVEEKQADISDKIERLLENNIEIHAQVVLCPEINDGKVLEKTLRDLASKHPKVVSTAVVPVALTRYNKDERLTKVTPEFCRKTIEEVGRLQEEFRKSLGTTFAFLGDEIYVKAGVPIPSRSHYGEYPQIEDGVGMIRTFEEEFDEMLGQIGGSHVRKSGGLGERHPRVHELAIAPEVTNSDDLPDSLNGTIFTGEMFAPFLRAKIQELNRHVGSSLRVVAVPNTYFGGDVSVAGLLSGQDFLAVKDLAEGDFVIIPPAVIKSDEPILIDGMPFEDLRSQFSRPVLAVDIQAVVRARFAGDAGLGLHE